MSYRVSAAALAAVVALASGAAAHAATLFQVRLFNVGGPMEVTLTDGVDTWSDAGWSALQGQEVLVDLTPRVTAPVDYTVFVTLDNQPGTFASYGWELLLDGVAQAGGVCGDLATATPCATLDLSTPGLVYQDFATFSGVVPEPGVWTLMIGGFGLLGAAVRQRRTIAA